MINRVVIVGRLTKNPELRKSASGNSFASFTVAVDNRTKPGEQKTAFLTVLPLVTLLII